MKSELKCINELKKLPPNTKVRVYYEDEKRRGEPVKKSKEERMTLAKLAKEMRDGFERIDARLDYNNLKKLPKSK